MFLPKEYFTDSLDILNDYQEFTDAELKVELYNEYASQIFTGFDDLTDDEKKKVLALVEEDISGLILNLYTFN